MLNFLVETKHEYTTQLINILTPLIFEGLSSIYTEVITISIPDNILKNFQCFLQRIPKWNNDIISRETLRIMNNTKSSSWLEDLIKATLKANIVVLTYNPSFKQQVKVDPSLYQNIKIEDFIHKIYIECARELWNNPYLFYHLYPPIELKRNQRDAVSLIKDCIKEALRKLLPVKHILHIYLGEDIQEDVLNFEEPISDAEQQNISKMIKKDLNDSIINLYQNKDNLQENKDNFVDQPSSINPEKINIETTIIDTQDIKPIITSDVFILNNENNSDENKHNATENKHNATENVTVGSKILSIINHKNLNLSDNETSSDELEVEHTDSNIKKIIENDLGESETSLNLQTDNKFHEVFSNSIIEEDFKKTKVNPLNQNKTKFFQKYLTNIHK